jgi:bifunctional UDP-N-acetylglucosamine pyrophosphorylase/glucosamine-1-phosphate N-acetyltransferase
LLRPETLAILVREHRLADAAATVLTAVIDDPTGYGRVVRDKDDRVRAIVEEPDANAAEKAINEVNTSIYCFRRSLLAPALRRLSPENAQGEYYLSDVIAVLHDAGYPVISVIADDPLEAAGVNDRSQRAAAEAALRARTNLRWMRLGVTMLDPARTYIDIDVTIEPDVTLFPATMLHGHTAIGRGARLGPDVRLTDCVVGADATVEQTVGHDAEIGSGAIVGPFAVLRPGSHVSDGARTGAFYTAAGADDEGD